ncbi:MAG: type II toxin-antitoxin system death-on-curing family toxin [Planctomycetaceae bacterium]|nr:type II toxin-antitoxin system death-on-curing family toxin [Planctomycetaceae bacterium]
MVFLTLDDIIESHQNQIDTYGGSHGIRDIGLLESAIAQPEASFGGQYLHADIFEMAAAYIYHLVMNHPFVDGNKRVGLEAALIFLEINDKSLIANDDELVDLVLKTTAGQIGKREIAEFFRSHCT